MSEFAEGAFYRSKVAEAYLVTLWLPQHVRLAIGSLHSDHFRNRSSIDRSGHTASRSGNIGSGAVRLFCSMGTAAPIYLRWTLHNGRAQVFHQDHHVVEFVDTTNGEKRFTFGGHSYTLRTSGVWKPRTTIQRDGTAVLRTVGAGAFKQPGIALADGTSYSTAWSNKPLAKLAFLDATGREVLSLRLATEGGVHTETLLAGDMPVDEGAVLLLAFAYAHFGGVMRGETGAEDLLLLVG